VLVLLPAVVAAENGQLAAARISHRRSRFGVVD
jgi:hypothetical protein